MANEKATASSGAAHPAAFPDSDRPIAKGLTVRIRPIAKQRMRRFARQHFRLNTSGEPSVGASSGRSVDEQHEPLDQWLGKMKIRLKKLQYYRYMQHIQLLHSPPSTGPSPPSSSDKSNCLEYGERHKRPVAIRPIAKRCIVSIKPIANTMPLCRRAWRQH